MFWRICDFSFPFALFPSWVGLGGRQKRLRQSMDVFLFTMVVLCSSKVCDFHVRLNIVGEKSVCGRVHVKFVYALVLL